MTDTMNDALIDHKIVSLLRALPRKRVRIIAEFITQAAVIDDPDVIETFVAYRRDPRLDSLLTLAARLDSDALDQLLFKAEDLAQECLAH